MLKSNIIITGIWQWCQ